MCFEKNSIDDYDKEAKRPDSSEHQKYCTFPSVPDNQYDGVYRPGYFSTNVDADKKRTEYDIKNQVLITHHIDIDFLFIGDSITDFWDLETYFHRDGCRIVSRAIGGDTIRILKKRFMADAVQLHPKYCVLQIGINDANAMEPNYWWVYPGKPQRDVLTDAMHDYSDILEQSKRAGMNLIICSLLPCNMPFSPVNRERQDYVLEMNKFLRNCSQQYGYIYVDYFSGLVKEDGRSMRDNISKEGLHPLVHGYDIMADILRNTLLENGIVI